MIHQWLASLWLIKGGPFFVACLLLTWPVWGDATTYYVSPRLGSNGNSCANADNGVASQAKATIDGVLSAGCATSGDTIEVFNDGTLTEGCISTSTYTIPNNLTFKSNSGRVPWTIANVGGASCAFLFSNKTGITVEGFAIDGAAVQGVNASVQSINIRDNSSGITIRNVSHRNLWATVGNPIWPRISIYESEPSAGIAPHDNIYEDNDDLDTNSGRHSEMWYINGSNHIIRRNTFRVSRVVATDLASIIWINGNDDRCTPAHGSDAHQIYENRFTVDSGMTAQAALAFNGKNQLVYNNLVIGRFTDGAVNTGYGCGYSRNNQIINNTIIGADRCVANGIFDASPGTIIQNNICSTSTLVTTFNGPAPTLITNYTGNPGYVNAAAGNYQISSASSPVVDTGTCKPSVLTTDFNGAPRPQGAACDIGAYESGGGTGNPAPLPAPAKFWMVVQ